MSTMHNREKVQQRLTQFALKLLQKMCIERDVVVVDVDVGVDGVGDGTVRQAWLMISSRCSPKVSKSVTNM